MDANRTTLSASGETLSQQEQPQDPFVNNEPQGLPIFTIPHGKIPGGFSLSFQEPTYGERKQAIIRYPGAEKKPGYSVDELLISNKITKINDYDWNQLEGEPIARWRNFSLEDSQYIVTVFSSLFLMTQELSDEAEKLSSELKKQERTDLYTIPKHRMPNKKFSVSFKRARSGDRMDAERRYPGMDSNCGYEFVDLFFAYCIQYVDGQPINKPADLVSLMDEWPTADQLFAMAVFANMATIDRKEETDAKELGKSLRAQLLNPISEDHPQPVLDFI